MRELFVYYRVRSADAPAARAAVLAMQDRLRASHPELNARLLTRTDGEEEKQTWMETYAMAAAPRGIDAEVEALVENSALPLARFIDGPRHIEAFDAGAPT